MLEHSALQFSKKACRRAVRSYVHRVQTTLDIDPSLLAKAEQAAAQIGQPLSAVVEHSLKLFLTKEKRVLQAPPGGYRGGSLEREDPFFSALARIEEERHVRPPREPIQFD